MCLAGIHLRGKLSVDALAIMAFGVAFMPLT
jgi:hypothetical protein